MPEGLDKLMIKEPNSLHNGNHIQIHKNGSMKEQINEKSEEILLSNPNDSQRQFNEKSEEILMDNPNDS
jgi:hypothetical protein